MPGLKVKLNGDGAWPDLAEKMKEGKFIEATEDIELAFLQGGMGSGATSVAIRINLPDGKVVWAQTSLKLFIAAAQIAASQFAFELQGEEGEEVKH